MGSVLLENCTLLHNGRFVEAHILTNEGIIEKISEKKIFLQTAKKIDCRNKIVIPGLIDSHVHFRTPGEEQKENWLTASRAALSGGVTTVLDMPNNNPPITSAEALEDKRKIVFDNSLVNFGFHFGGVERNENEILNAKNIASVKVFTGLSTGNLLLENKQSIELVFRAAQKKRVVVCVHAENNREIEKNKKKFQRYSDPLIHSKIRSARAESLAIEELLDVQKKVKNALYFCHVSSKEGIKLIAEAKEKSDKIFCEVTPHHLFLTEKSLEKLRNFGKVNPSIKSEKDKNALWKAIKDGVVDVIASDHAPHLESEKKLSYWSAPSGMPGVETMLPLLLDAASKKKIKLEKIVELCCENPAKIFGIKNKGFLREGFDADIVVLDLEKSFVVSNKKIYSKCAWSAFNGLKLKGVVDTTICSGEVAYSKGDFFRPALAKEVVLNNG